MNIQQTYRDIKSVKIQGATNVAKTSLEIAEVVSQRSKAKTFSSYLKEIKDVERKVLSLRPTEPMVENLFELVLAELKELKTIEEAKKNFPKVRQKHLKEILLSREKISKIGSEMIKNNSTVLTHCHASTVTNILKLAKSKGKKFRVICTETRPLYQGRRTAKDLIKNKIDTTMIVDSGVSNIIKQVDMAFVGADLLTVTGEAVNKIGSTNVALACRRVNIPFYVCSTLMKIEPQTLKGKYPKVEQREGREIWDKPPKGLKFVNPAFEVIPNDLISAIITEKGVVRPDSLYSVYKDYIKLTN